MAKAKMTVKKLEEKETHFRPVPYETNDVRTSITLLSSIEIDIVTRSLSTLSKYSDEKELNVCFLYKNGVVPKLLDLLVYSNPVILRFTLKLISQIVTVIPEAAVELSFEQYINSVKQIAYLLMTSMDSIVKEFCVQFLAHVVKCNVLASNVFKLGVVPVLFELLVTSQDVDTIYYTLLFFERLLAAYEASNVIPKLAEFSPHPILCYLKHKVAEIREEALNVIEKLASWKSSDMQSLLRTHKAIEKILELVLDEDYKESHKKCLDVILVCMECPETKTYFAQSLEFVKFTQWCRTCDKKLMLPALTILVILWEEPSLKQFLFDFSVEDSILSFFRTDEEDIFAMVCEGICNMSTHMYCCEKIVTPVVIKCLLAMLGKGSVPIIPYHEMAIKTLLTLLKRNENTIAYILGCDGIDPLKKAAMSNKDQYTSEGYYNILYVIFIFASTTLYRPAIMDKTLYGMLLNRFQENSEYSNLAVLTLDQYINDPECREYFVELNGPYTIITLLSSTPNEELFKNTLLYMERIFPYKQICKLFLWQGGLTALNKFNRKLKSSIPLIDRLTTMIYNIYLPLKFFKLGRLDITDHFDSRFHLVEPFCEDFPYLEFIERMQVSPKQYIYVVDFGANVSELTKKPLPKPEITETSVTNRKSQSRSRIKLGRLSSVKSSRLFRSSSTVLKDDGLTLLCQIPPPIKYGFLSDDPYLPQYLSKMQKVIYENENYVFCFQHQIKAIAKFVDNVLSGPPYPGNQASKSHTLAVHLKALRAKLGTTLIPLGYLRYGFHCERSLLFKALSDKMGVPTTLVRGKVEGKNNLIYWNEVPVVCNEHYENIEDLKTYMTYAVVDLMKDIGNLKIVGTIEANEYCGIPLPEHSKDLKILTLRNIVDHY